MKNKSIWNDIKINHKNKLIDNNTDILIIGAGIAGISIAYFLKDTNYKITVVDKDNIGGTTTSKTTGKINYLQGGIYEKIEKSQDKQKAFMYYKSQKEAVNIINEIIKSNKIDCDLKKEPSIDFTLETDNIPKIDKEYALLKEFEAPVKYVKDKRIKKGILVNDGYSFHPIKYLNSLYEKLNKRVSFYSNILVSNISKQEERFIVMTNKGTLNAKIVVVACHYPFFIIPLFTPLKTYVKREYVCSCKYKEDKPYNAISIDKDTKSIRFYKDNIIYVSNPHKLTSKLKLAQNYKKAIENFKKTFKREPELIWMNQDIMSHDHLPFIGRIEDNLYVATSFNSWGITNGTISGKVISDIIINGKSEYEELFNPKRCNLSIIKNSLINTVCYLSAYIRAPFIKNPKYIKEGGVLFGVYEDEYGNQHKIKLLCPHMKCKLIFNAKEETWDCPCHGSRFDLDGNLISGPSKESLKK